MYRIPLIILACIWTHLAPVYSQDSLSFSLKVIEELPPFSVNISTTPSLWDFQMPFDYVSQSPDKATKKFVESITTCFIKNQIHSITRDIVNSYMHCRQKTSWKKQKERV
ncbi:hypothetical protein [Xanthocytophaga flava]|uniref:hypothetical protein n=1 Tax=Xanthocytophaga flava TaxID=3048013 RepID=UPI0028D28333|nr:hypothetical protein [Xanthocytophaga flavus]MDJ1469895.1 hypothetical protein [Xanthocytophaga flavus]